AQERKDFRRLSLDRRTDRSIVHERDAMIRRQARQSGLELQCLLYRLVHEIFDDLLAPWPQRAAAKTSTESPNAREADTAKLPRIAVEHVHTDVGENLSDVALLARFE